MMQIIKKLQNMNIKTMLTRNYKSLIKQGVGFLIYAILVDVLDEVILPLTLTYFGYPVLGGAVLLGDLDWLTYPLYFLVKNKFF